MMIKLKSDEYYSSLLVELDRRFGSYTNTGTYIPTHTTKQSKRHGTKRGTGAALAALIAYNKTRQQTRIKCLEGYTHVYLIMPSTKSPNGKLLEKCTHCKHRRTAISA